MYQSFQTGKKWISQSLGIIAFLALSIYAQSLEKQTIDHYFAQIMDDFNHVVSAPVMTRTNLRAMDLHFVESLKQHQIIYSLIRTNSKGTVISEVIRGKAPLRNFRDISGQMWFQKVKQSFQDYYSLEKSKETGRYYLFWCKPVLKSDDQFVGAVVAKIDLWDCFHILSKETNSPFLVLLGNMSLYSHKWEKELTHEEQALTVPGVNDIVLRYVNEADNQTASAIAAHTDMPADAQPSLTAEKSQIVTQPQEVQSESTNRVNPQIIIGLIVVALILVSILVFQLVTWIKHKMLMKKIENESLY